MANYIITGGAGFIGSNIVDRLIADGHRALIIDNFASGQKHYLNPKADLIERSIIDLEYSCNILSNIKFEGIFHCAAQARIQPSINDPAYTTETNVRGTQSVLEFAKRLGINKLVYSSSSSIYGNSINYANDCLNPYAASKLSGEVYCQAYRNMGVQSVSLRYYNVYGPRAFNVGPYATVPGKFFEQMLAGKPITVVGDGEQRRDFTYIDDVVEANIVAMNHMEDFIEHCECVVDVGTGTNYSINEVVGMIRDITQAPFVEVARVNERPGESKHTKAWVTAHALSKRWKARVDLRTGLARYYKHYQQHGY